MNQEKKRENRAVLRRLIRDARPIYGWLLLACGEEARGAFERMIIQKHAAREKTQPRTKNVPEPVREQAQEPDAPAEAARAWPERRWPPPPCWPQAEYAQGCWQEQA